MKRIITLLLAAGLVLGAAGAGNATDVKVKGMWDFSLKWYNKGFKSNGGADYFEADQRLRTQVDFIASESLKGVVFFEIGDQNWGKGSEGASLGTDGIRVEVRYSYIDWVVPNTDLKVRMGLQHLILPNAVAGSAVLDHDVAGIVANYSINENVGVNLFWARLENDNNEYTKRDDAFDLVGLTIPLTFDGVSVTPWGAYASIGRLSLSGDAGGQVGWMKYGLLPVGALDSTFISSDESRGDAWWAGLAGDITLFNPFRIAFDFNYGGVDMGRGLINGQAGDLERTGWMASLLGEYKMDMMTPGLIFWYASGDDDDPYDGSEALPSMRPCWTATSYGYDGYAGPIGGDVLGQGIAGTWAVVAQVKDISFMEDLSHVFRVGYIQGTNDKAMAQHVGSPLSGNGLYMTEDDDAWEVNFDTTYNIYENLTLSVELAYLHLNMDDGVWGDDIVEENNIKAGINMRYSF